MSAISSRRFRLASLSAFAVLCLLFDGAGMLGAFWRSYGTHKVIDVRAHDATVSAASYAALDGLLQRGGAPERLRGVLAFQAGGLEQAIPLFAAGHARRPDLLTTYLLGKALVEAGQREAGLAAWQELGETTMRGMVARFATTATQAYGHQDRAGAALYAALAVGLNGSLPDPYFVLGHVAVDNSKFEDALVDFQRALERETRPRQQLAIYRGLAKAYLGQENYAEAAYYYGLFVEAIPDDADTRLLLADLLIHEGRFAEAKIHLDVLLTADDRNVQALRKLAQMLDMQGNDTEAADVRERIAYITARTEGGD